MKNSVLNIFIYWLVVVVLWKKEYVTTLTLVSSPATQFNTTVGDQCVVDWVFLENITGLYYNVQNYTSGSGVIPDSIRTNLSVWNSTTVRFVISPVSVYDAGSYALVIGAPIYTALVFVYDKPLRAVLTQDYGQNPATEGSTVRLTCLANSTSQRAEYRPGMAYTFKKNNIPIIQLTNNSLTWNGVTLDRYSLTKDGSILTVSPVSSSDQNNYFSCTGTEGGSRLQSDASISWLLQVYWHPTVSSTSPISRTFNVLGASVVTLVVYYSANPAASISWSRTDINGTSAVMPTNITISRSLSFLFNSSEYYGDYLCTLNNSVGETMIKFKVIPPGSPETPANFQAYYLSPVSLGVMWTSMWNNGQVQNFIIELWSSSNSSGTSISNVSISDCGYNSTCSARVSSELTPNTNYLVTVSANNTYGQSNSSILPITTPLRPQLNIMNTQINDSDIPQLVFDLYVDNFLNSTYMLSVECCDSTLYQCTYYSTQLYSSQQRVEMDTPNGNNLTLDLYVRDEWSYLVYFLKDISVNGISNTKTEENVAVIILAVLLAVFVAISVILGILLLRFYLKSPPLPSNGTPNQAPSSADAVARQSPIFEEDKDVTYEQVNIEEIQVQQNVYNMAAVQPKQHFTPKPNIKTTHRQDNPSEYDNDKQLPRKQRYT